MPLLPTIMLVLLSGTSYSAEQPLDHHGRWVTAALLTETILQESAILEAQQLQTSPQLPAQLKFLDDLATKISYTPTENPKSNRIHLKKQAQAMAELPHWQDWSYLEATASKLVPLCHETSHSPSCTAFRSVHQPRAGQLAAIQTLERLAREQPKNYSTDNVQAYHTLLLLRQRNFPEALRVLFDLQLADAKFKLIYNKIQRIYSLHQKAQGDVVLRQSL